MKCIIAGGRNYILSDDDYEYLHGLGITEVVSGGATGADACGELWGSDNGLLITTFPADWDTHGPAAGPIRNRQMAEYADAVVLYPGGRGTESMKREAERAGIVVHDPHGYYVSVT
jgi:hypothetical protein